MAWSASRSFQSLILSAFLATTLLSDLTSAGDPVRAALKPEEIRREMMKTQERRAAVMTRIHAVRTEEERWEKEINQLKESASGLTQPLQELRLQNALRQLRDRLLELQRLQREEEALKTMEVKTREQLKTALQHQAEDFLKKAEQSFKSGREREADTLYQRALGLMGEYQNLSEPPPRPDVMEDSTFEPGVTGREGPAELRQLAILMRDEAEEAQHNLKLLDQAAQQIESELAIEKRALRFQGIRERETEQSKEPVRTLITRKAALEQELANIREHVQKHRDRIQRLLGRAEELERSAAKKEEGLIEGKHQ